MLAYAQSSWNSLEVVKLVVSLLTPLTILLLGIWVTRLGERFKALIWANQKVIEKRIAIYDELAPLLNGLFCYYYFVGNWKELSPPQIIEIKRNLDKKVHVYSPLFSSKFKKCYDRFIELCFETYLESGGDPKLRTSPGGSPKTRKECFPQTWNDAWDEMFSDEAKRASENAIKGAADEIKKAYVDLMDCFAKELGVIGRGN